MKKSSKTVFADPGAELQCYVESQNITAKLTIEVKILLLLFF